MIGLLYSLLLFIIGTGLLICSILTNIYLLQIISGIICSIGFILILKDLYSNYRQRKKQYASTYSVAIVQLNYIYGLREPYIIASI